MGDPRTLQIMIDELGVLTHELAERIRNPLNTADDFLQCAADAKQLSETLLMTSGIRREISSQID